MRIFLPLLLLAFPILASADYIVKQQINTSGQVQDVTLEIKGDLCRVETSDETSAIVNAQTGETIVLLKPQKVFVKIPGEQMKVQAEAMRQLMQSKGDKAPDHELTATGKKEVINGFNTEEFTYTLGGVQTVVSVTKDVPNYQQVAATLYNIQSGPTMEVFRSLSLPPDKLPGLPVRTVVQVLGQTISTTLVSVQEATFPADDFTMPSDYRELSQAASPTPAPSEPRQ